MVSMMEICLEMKMVSMMDNYWDMCLEMKMAFSTELN